MQLKYEFSYFYFKPDKYKYSPTDTSTSPINLLEATVYFCNPSTLFKC